MRICRSPRVLTSRNVFLAAAAAATMAGPAARAQTVVTWVGATGDYNSGTNWSSGATPTLGANEYLQVNNGGTAQVSSNAEGSFLHLGYQPGDVGHLEVTSGMLTLGELRVGGRETIPDGVGGFVGNGGGTGTVVQSGDSIVAVTYSTGAEPPVQSTYIGDSGLASGNTANGSYLIKDNAALYNGVSTSDQIVIGTGPGARGTFTQQDNSTVISTGTIIVGRRGATASYSISGTATLTATNNMHVGDAETADGAAAGTVGSFTQTGGTVNTGLNASMEIGRKGGTGTYSISAGTLNLQHQLNVGSAGTMSVDGVTVPAPGQQNSVGTLNISGTANVTTTNGRNIFIGFNNGQTTFQPTLTSSGFFNMTGGTMTLSNTLFMIGSGSGSTGTVNISGGILQNADGVNVEYDIGRFAGSGTLNLSGTGTLKGNTLLVGAGGSIGNSGELNVSGNATLTLTGGLTLSGSPLAGTTPVRTININGGTVSVGSMGGTTTTAGAITRNFNMTAGTLSVAGALTGGNAVTWNFNGGSATIGSANFTSATINIGGTANVSFTGTVNTGTNQGGNVTVSGGTLSAGSSWRIMNGTPPGGTTGSLTVSGGTANIPSLFTGGSTSLPSTINYTGGTLNAGSINFNNGATLNTANNVTLASTLTGTQTGTITVNANSGSISLTGPFVMAANGQSITKNGPGTLNLSGPWTYNAAPGTPTLSNTAGLTNINVDISGPVTLAASGGTLRANAPQSVRGITLSGTGSIDLVKNTLTVDPTVTSAATVRGYLASAFNNGLWNQPGLTSSAAAARSDHATSLAYIDHGTSLTVLYTWGGDLNLDLKMNGDDYVLIDKQVAINGFGSAATWITGDVNYDGVLTLADYARMDASYAGANGGTLSPAFLAMRQAQFGSEYVAQLTAAIPEPGCLAFAAAGATLLASRRQRRR